ncbi:MAG: hypothetical protein H0U57_05725 [Tatlockia sp.]|nr:hypothetical protein [Tatlockia sp.]
MGLDNNLQQYLIKRPEKTFLVRASGDSMINAGIKSGALLIVDNSKSLLMLMPENPIFLPLK